MRSRSLLRGTRLDPLQRLDSLKLRENPFFFRINLLDTFKILEGFESLKLTTPIPIGHSLTHAHYAVWHVGGYEGSPSLSVPGQLLDGSPSGQEEASYSSPLGLRLPQYILLLREEYCVHRGSLVFFVKGRWEGVRVSILLL